MSAVESITVLTPGELANCPVADEGAVGALNSTMSILVASGNTMERHCAPGGWEGEAAELARHQMVGVVAEIDETLESLRRGAHAMSKYCGEVKRLSSRHRGLEYERDWLIRAAADLERRAAAGPLADPVVAEDAVRHNGAVKAWDGDAARWAADLTAAQQVLIDSLVSSTVLPAPGPGARSSGGVASLTLYARLISKSPQLVAEWWSTLPAPERDALIAARSDFVGNLNGLPTTVRDVANRTAMDALQKKLQAIPTGERSAGQRRMLRQIAELKRALDNAERLQLGVGSYLLVFNLSAAHGDGEAAVSYGDPDAADNVSVNVPGYSSTVDDFEGVANAAAYVNFTAKRYSRGSVASIAWLGYDAPDNSGVGLRDVLSGPSGLARSVHGVEDAAEVGRERNAAVGASKLSAFVDSLRATHRGARANLTVIGHSYGSTTVAKASAAGMPADSVVLAGSPGAGGGDDSAKDLTGKVYVEAEAGDPISHLGTDTTGHVSRVGLGVDPASKTFGATRMQADTPYPSILKGLKDHSSYFKANSESLNNIGLVVAGKGDQVEQVAGRSAGANTSYWLGRKTKASGAEHGLLDPFEEGRH